MAGYMNWLMKEAIDVWLYSPSTSTGMQVSLYGIRAISMLEQGRAIKRHHNKGSMTDNVLECLG
jgi:hypothetical protein